MEKFDFDGWMKLFQDNPEEAERRRKEEIDAIIAKAPPERQERLRRLQWRIDMERERHKASPLGSCIALNKMLMEKVHGAGGLVYHLRVLNDLLRQKLSGIDGGTESFSPRDARMLDFPKK